MCDGGLFADQVAQQVESLGPVPVQRRPCVTAALSNPSHRHPLPTFVDEHLAGGHVADDDLTVDAVLAADAWGRARAAELAGASA